MSERRRRTVPGILLSLVIIGVGVVLVATWWQRGAERRDVPPQRYAGGALVVQAHEGDYLVVERIENGTARATVGSADLTVATDDGRAVLVRAAPDVQRQHEGSSTRIRVARFTTPAAGTYALRVAGGATVDLTVERPGANVWTWLARGALSALVVTVGLTLLLVVMARARADRRYSRRRAEATTAASAAHELT